MIRSSTIDYPIRGILIFGSNFKRRFKNHSINISYSKYKKDSGVLFESQFNKNEIKAVSEDILLLDFHHLLSNIKISLIQKTTKMN